MTNVFFSEQQNGYDKTQVDNYIQKVTEAYQAAYKEYLDTCEKYNNLMQEYKKLETEKRSGINADIIAKTLISSEKLAQEIVDNAHAEEAKIVDMTVQNVEYAYKTLENAMGEIKKFLTFNSTAASGQKRDVKELGGMLNEIEIPT